MEDDPNLLKNLALEVEQEISKKKESDEKEISRMKVEYDKMKYGEEE